MDLGEYFRSVLEQDPAPVVLCNLNHEIVYMNPSAAERYAKYGGRALVGRSLMDCHPEEARKKIEEVLGWFEKSPQNNSVYEFRNEKENKDVYMVALRDGSGNLIGYYEKHEYRNNETAKFYDFR